MYFNATSDSELSKGLAAVLVHTFSGLTLQEIMEVEAPSFIDLALGPGALPASTRMNALSNVAEAMRRAARYAADPLAPRFPSLLITGEDITPQGAFAEAQAQYLAPDQGQVSELASLLSQRQIGVVAHFYMDPQVQGVLMSARDAWPHIAISDSLVMADTAVKMAASGCRAIVVLGVDFMSENVRAVLDEAGHADVAVYRVASDPIGCSLAEAAEGPAYDAFLREAAGTPRSLHVVYINTSLRTKAAAAALVPTITCTSSNVVQTVLQAFAQVPDLTVWYGPDTYMGRNLHALFAALAEGGDDAAVRALHPAHSAASVAALLPRLKHFQDGTCIVHHIFGAQVVEGVRRGYGDAFITAHFEVPGEMFALAQSAGRAGRGVVGSTSNILDFITAKVSAALAAPAPGRLVFVLGTEAGMVTSIVRVVQSLLRHSGRDDVEVEVVFPVADNAITTPEQQQEKPAVLPTGLAVLPGPAMGEGCSLEGGCAACPYMKMNTLSALLSVCQRVGSPAGEALLAPFRPRAYSERTPDGRSIAAAGCGPILHMRHFQQTRRLPDSLVDKIVAHAQ